MIDPVFVMATAALIIAAQKQFWTRHTFAAIVMLLAGRIYIALQIGKAVWP